MSTYLHRRWCKDHAPFSVKKSENPLDAFRNVYPHAYVIVDRHGKAWDSWHTEKVAQGFADNWNREAAVAIMVGVS